MTHSNIKCKKDITPDQLAKRWIDFRTKPSLAAILEGVGYCDSSEMNDNMPEEKSAKNHALALEVFALLEIATSILSSKTKPGAPGRLLFMKCWADQNFLKTVIRMLETDFLRNAIFDTRRGDARPKILLLPTVPMRARALAEEKEKFRSVISKYMLDNHSVVIVGGQDCTDMIGPDLAAICEDLPELSRPKNTTLSKLLELLYPVLPTAGTVLQDPAAISRLSALQLTSAFREETAHDALARLASITTKRAQATATGMGPKLSDVIGQPRAVNALRQIASDVLAWQSGRVKWSDILRSMIFHGPPGTGKTMLATCFAADAGLPLVHTSFGECQQNGHLGDMLAALDAAVTEAVEKAPSVFFIDEIDAFGNRQDTSSAHRNSGYMRAVVTALLRQLDRLTATPGIVILAATNDLTAVDPAIQRAGRFDLQLPILLPSIAAIEKIIAENLPDDCELSALEQTVKSCAIRMQGCSSADAAALARDAAMKARIAKEPLSAPLLLSVLDSRHPGFTAEDTRRIALHEAGHIAAGLATGLPRPTSVSISPKSSCARWPHLPLMTPRSTRALIITLLAGRAAEIVFFGQASSGSGNGNDSDLAQVTALAKAYHSEWCLSDAVPRYEPFMPASPTAAGYLRQEIENTLAKSERDAKNLVEKYKDEIEAFALKLMTAGELSGDALISALPDISSEQVHDPNFMTG